MKILITGANGQLGNALQTIFNDHELFAYDHAGLEISDESMVVREVTRHRPQAIINAAAYNNVDRAETEPDEAQRINGKAPGILAKAAASVGALIVHVSTDYVFDGKKGSAYTERDSTNPLSVYGRSKLAGEEAVARANPNHIVARTAWVYHTHGKNFLSTMIEMSRKGPLKIANDQFSSPTNALDLARGLRALMEKGKKGVFHVANSGAASRLQQFSTFAEDIGLKVEITPVSSREFRQAAVRPVYSALATDEPTAALPPWQEALREFAKAWEVLHA